MAEANTPQSGHTKIARNRKLFFRFQNKLRRKSQSAKCNHRTRSHVPISGIFCPPFVIVPFSHIGPDALRAAACSTFRPAICAYAFFAATHFLRVLRLYIAYILHHFSSSTRFFFFVPPCVVCAATLPSICLVVRLSAPIVLSNHRSPVFFAALS
ncbi:hypothetical protein PUMCH_003441 [Australozyma saopauloensis]|uniref:Transmembrane protein n=1 Tax=Australozyma saopauloensis TaxID=291208 RepID=A0AAX4HC65_9ASCO|nr:hypothetical protein PUMCH_003441 [[Candida] saopauloensis]